MEDQPVACSFCEQSVEIAVTDDEGHRYCSTGCREVANSLESVANEEETQETDVETASSSGKTTFLHVDGMHCGTCEQFLESVAVKHDHVSDANASYVTETIRVEFNPAELSEEELCSHLSQVGYTVIPRDELATVADDRKRRDDERHMDDLLGFRYAAGVLFGFFMFLPYIVVIYPAQLSELLGFGTMGLFSGGRGPGDGILILPLFLVLTSVVLFFTGLPVLRGAYVSLRMRKPNTDLLVTITIVSAYLYGTLAFAVGNIKVYYDLTIVIAATVVAAIFYESLIKQRAVDRLTELTVSQVAEAHRYDGTQTTDVPVEELEPGDRLLVKEGERIPVDGTLISDSCTVDEAVVTGESLPVGKKRGDELVGGSIVRADSAVVEVGDPPTSSIDGLTTAVWDLQSATHGLQRRSDQVAMLIVPTLVSFAVFVGLSSLLFGRSLSGAIFTILAVLLVCCPWAVGLSTPLSVARSIREAMERGIVIFDETVFERLRDTDVVVFDKTGTLTTGKMRLIDADAPEELLTAAGILEAHAAHPAGKVIATQFGEAVRTDGGTDRKNKTGSDPDETISQLTEVTTHATGIEGVVGGNELLVGNLDLFGKKEWAVPTTIEQRANEQRAAGNLPVVIGQDGRAEGIIILGDSPRKEWDETIGRLADRDVETVVLTGDDEAATTEFQSHAAVDHVFAGVPPAGKTETIRRLQADGHVTMVGDGTNDGPALAAADLGISISSGTALAAEAADIAILDDDLSTVETAFDLSQAARRRLYQNTGLALLYNALTIPIALVGFLNPLFVMAAAVVSSGLIALNSFRSILSK